MTQTKSTCPYCGVGCGVLITSEGDQITAVAGDLDHPANFGRLCTKGSTLHLTVTKTVQMQARVLSPQLRASKDAARAPVDWTTATDAVANKIVQVVRDHGPDAVGLYLSGQLLTEDYYVFNKLVKGLLGTNNVDTNSRLCMSSAVAGYKKTLGSDSVPCSYEDIDHAQTLLIAGSNTAFAHPVLYRRIEDARRRNPALKTIVIDPRRTDTAQEADLHLAILPGTDVALFHGMLHLMLWEGWVDAPYIAAHTEGFDAIKALVRGATPAETARICGIAQEQLIEATRLFAQHGPALSLYCQGLNQSSDGTNKNAALINLHLATGQIGKPGAGPFSLTGQPNAMGGREVGGLANLLPAHRDLANPAHRSEVARLWGVDAVPEQPGASAVEMFDAAAAGKIKVLWIVCTNPAQSLPNQSAVRQALQTAEMVIVQEAFSGTATVPYADVLLPASAWGEKDGTVTNSERRISRQRGAVRPVGEARHDWQIGVDVARKIEAQLRPGKPSLFDYDNPEQIWNEHRATTAGTDCDITGLSWPLLEESGPQQWPFAAGASSGKARLFADGHFTTPSGKAQFYAQPYKPAAETTDARFPLALNTGRLRDQWHGMSRTGVVPQLFAHVPEPVLEMNGKDMARRGLQAGDLVQMTSRRGAQIAPVAASDALRSGQTFMAMHWGQEFLSGGHDDGTGGLGVNALTQAAFDPVSKQPELKHAALKVTKAELPWRAVAFAWLPDAAVHDTLGALRTHMKSLAFASCVPFGRERTGALLRMGHHQAPDAAWLQSLTQCLGLQADWNILRYSDKRRGLERAVQVENGSIAAVWLVGDLSAEPWLKSFLESGSPVAGLGRALLSPGASAPAGSRPRGAIICNCLNVSADEIADTLERCSGSPAQRLSALQAERRCGTQCGSCMPELKRLVAAASTPLAA